MIYHQEGLIKLLVLIILAVIVLGFFGISLKAVFQKETVKENLTFVWDAIRYVWDKYLAEQAPYLWNIFYNLLWRSFVENAERIRGGKPPLLLEIAPKMPPVEENTQPAEINQ